MEEENKKVTRRKFLEDSSKKAIAGTAAAFLGLGMVKPKAAQAAGCVECRWSCENGCFTGCYTTCTDGCTGSCYNSCWGSCSHVCDTSCYLTCKEFCSGSCTSECKLLVDQSFSALPETCGTPVLEREASNRHVIA